MSDTPMHSDNPSVFMFGNGPAKYVYASAFDQMRHQKERLGRELQEARELLSIIVDHYYSDEDMVSQMEMARRFLERASNE